MGEKVPEGVMSRRNAVKGLMGLLGLGVTAAIVAAAPASEKQRGNPVTELMKYLEGKDPQELGPVIAEFLLNQGIAFAKAMETLRKGGTEVPSSAMPEATFYIAPAGGPNGDTLSMGFRTDMKADWISIYAAKGAAGPWFQFVQIKQDRDASGNPTNGVNIVPLFQYGTRGDGFDINPNPRP
jgi:hypothetical protein